MYFLKYNKINKSEALGKATVRKTGKSFYSFNIDGNLMFINTDKCYNELNELLTELLMNFLCKDDSDD